MKKTYYTNIEKKKLCNRNNGELKTLPRFDFQMEDYFSVIFVDSLNKIIEIDPTDQFYIAGGLDVMKNSENLLFYSEDFTLENNRLTFTIDTYTDNYLKHIKNTNTPIYLEIGILNEKKTILLQDIVLAEPRVYLDGISPTNIEVYYTKAQIDEKLAAVKIEQTDPIYTADKDTILFKGGLNINGITDDNGNITITSDDIISMYSGNEYSITEELQYIEETTTNNLIDYVNEQKYIKTIGGIQPDDEGNIDIAVQYTDTDSNDIQMSKGFYQRNLNNLVSLTLHINENSNDSALLFSTGDTFTITLDINSEFKVAKDFEFQPNKTYLIAVDNYTILWTEVKDYIS